MLRRLSGWVEDRTGVAAAMRHLLDEQVQGGARWAYVFGSALTIILGIQVVTGILLMTAYSPAAHTAWPSVWYIQHRIGWGWMVRGVHHYGAQAMVIVLAFHLVQVSLYGAYKKPREVNWWLGLGLMGATLGLALTGYLLPWDQKGYWATRVATNIAGGVPVIGAAIQSLLQGGPEYGHLTLTRFYALHVAVLPASIVLLLFLHVALFRRHGVTPPAGADRTRTDPFSPNQLAKDVVAGLIVVGAIVGATMATGGAPLDAPADAGSDYPARPEWYFLGLFQLLKYFEGPLEIVGTVVLPGLAGGFLFVLPLLDRSPSTRVRDRLPWVGALAFGGVCVTALTILAWVADSSDAAFQRARESATSKAERASFLAWRGVPPEGPLVMLRRDPDTRGPELWAEHCESCHSLGGQGGTSAPDLGGFGSRAWIHGMLASPDAPHYFGGTELKGQMPSQASRLGEAGMRAVTEFLYAEGREARDPAVEESLRQQGQALFRQRCMNCHVYRGDGSFLGTAAPNLSYYASRTWIRRHIENPASEATYGSLNRGMPRFDDQLDAFDLGLLTTWLRRQRLASPHPRAATPAAPTPAPANPAR